MSGEEILGSIVQIVRNYQAQYEISGVGVSAPGTVREDGFMVTAGAIGDFYGINLKETLEGQLNLPVVVENDANCVALAEKWLGAGANLKHFVCVVIGTGLGGAMVLNGEIFRGATSNAGEFGYMIVEDIHEANTRLATLSLTAAVKGGIIDKYELKTNQALTGEAIYRLSQENDVIAKEVIDRFYHSLAKGIFNLSISFDPEAVLVGGAISQNPELVPRLRLELEALKAGHRDMGNLQLPHLKTCHFENDAGIIGAVYLLLTHLGRKIPHI